MTADRLALTAALDHSAGLESQIKQLQQTLENLRRENRYLRRKMNHAHQNLSEAQNSPAHDYLEPQHPVENSAQMSAEGFGVDPSLPQPGRPACPTCGR